MSPASTPEWDSALARAKAMAQATGRDPQYVLREYLYERLLARVFHNDGLPWVLRDPPWVLKGGIALLARVEDTRYSLDVDILHVGIDIEKAVAELRELLALDLGDGLRFVAGRAEPGRRPQLAGQRRVLIEVYTGAKRRARFHVDVVTGSQMTADPDTVTARAGLGVPGLTPPTYRLYPVVDHVADKVCATEELTAGRPSSRTHDLVDLVVFARTQTVDGNSLIEAITAERHHRGLPSASRLIIPRDWARAYPKQAQQTRHCVDLDFAAACDVAKKFVDPALDGTAAERTWSPTAAAWVALSH